MVPVGGRGRWLVLPFLVAVCRGCAFGMQMKFCTRVGEIFFAILEKVCTFASGLVARKGVKRESGESPEQSRCCEFSSLPFNVLATAHRHRCVGRLKGKERVRRPAKSENIGPLSRKKCPVNRNQKAGCAVFSPSYRSLFSLFAADTEWCE